MTSYFYELPGAAEITITDTATGKTVTYRSPGAYQQQLHAEQLARPWLNEPRHKHREGWDDIDDGGTSI